MTNVATLVLLAVTTVLLVVNLRFLLQVQRQNRMLMVQLDAAASLHDELRARANVLAMQMLKDES